MTFTVSKGGFVSALDHLSKAVRGRGNQLNACLRLEVEGGTLRLSVHGDLGLSLSLPVDAGLMGEVAPLAVPAALLHELARNMASASIGVQVRPGGLDLMAGSNAVHVAAVSATPDELAGMLPDFKHGPAPVALSLADLRSAAAAVQYASSGEAFQAVMRGVLIEFGPERVRMVASDGFRLALADMQASSPEAFSAIPMTRLLVPALKALEGAEHCAVSVNDGWLIARTAAASVMVPLLDGEYPSYERIVPKVSEKTVTLDAAALLAAISRVSVMSDKANNNRVEFTVSPDEAQRGGRLTLTAEGDYGRGREVLEIQVGPAVEAMSVGFNARYLTEALSACTGKVTLDFIGGPTAPIRISSGTAGVLAVVVPLRA